jgi:hypothetical protein
MPVAACSPWFPLDEVLDDEKNNKVNRHKVIEENANPA